MRKILLASGACLIMAAACPAGAQTLPWNNPGEQSQPAPIAGAQIPVTAPGQQTMYPVKSANIRAGAGTTYNVIGKVPQGQPVAVLGPVPGNPGWFQLASGGYVSASVLSPTPVAIVPVHRRPIDVPPPSQNYYPVGACEPYSRVVNIGGQPSQINGTACKQPDGTWRISNYGVPVPVEQPAPPPPPPVVYAPPPVVYGAPPVIVEEHGGYYHDHYHDRYWRD